MYLLIKGCCNAHYSLRNEQQNDRPHWPNGLQQEAGERYAEWLTAKGEQAKNAVHSSLKMVGDHRESEAVRDDGIDRYNGEAHRVDDSQQQRVRSEPVEEPRYRPDPS